MSGFLHRNTDESDLPLFSSANLSRGRELRDEGTEAVLSRDVVSEYRERAKAWLRDRAEKPGAFNMDDMRAEIGDPPGHPNSIGALALWAVREGLIEHCGERARQAASAHAQRIRLYRGRGA